MGFPLPMLLDLIGGMGSFVKRRWATGFSLLGQISAGSLRSNRNYADRKLGARMMMMSTAVNLSPSSRVMSPWLMLPPVFEEGGDMVYKFYNLSEDKEESFRKKRSESENDDAKFVGSSLGWLALFNAPNNNHLFLSNPITRRHINLPPIQTLPDPRINLTPDGRGSVFKLILSSSPDDDEECIAMIIFGPERRLAVCNPCRSTEWTPIGDLYYQFPKGGVCARSYLDCVYSSTQKLLFCQSGLHLECWDLADPLSPRICSSWKVCLSEVEQKGKFLLEEKLIRSMDCYPEVRRYVSLVYAEQYNQIFIVMQYVMARMSPDGSYVAPIYFGRNRGWGKSFLPYRTIGLDAYKFDFGAGNPQYMEGSLDGLAMFIGLNHSMAMSVTPESKLSSNCIYYTESDRFPIPPSPFYGGHDIGIFDYTNRTISPCYYFPLDIESIKRIMPAPMWFTPCGSRPHP